MTTTRTGRVRVGRRSLAVIGVALLLAVAPRVGADPVGPFVPPLPEVDGPIPTSESSFPFIGAGTSGQLPLPPGYVEEEYIVSGAANIYDWDFPVGVELVETRTYKTRILVRRPTNANRFSGRVQLELFNPSSGFDVAIVWAKSQEYFTRSGDVWVGVSIQPSVIRALKAFNVPVNQEGGGGGNGRYDALLDPPGTGDPIFSEQGQAWDIAAQIGRLLKTATPSNPLSSNGFDVERIYMSGQSQTGAYTITYVNGFDLLERMPGDAPIFDGYMPQAFTLATRINELGRPGSNLPPLDPRNRIVAPHGSPVIQVLTETEASGIFGPPAFYRRDDSDDPMDRFRLYEVPGASHADDDIFRDLQPGVGVFYAGVIQLRGTGYDGPVDPDTFTVPIPWAFCGYGPQPAVAPNPFPLRYVEAAAFENLDRWATEGVPAPRADRVVDPPQTNRDANGNAIGGVRTPYLDVPTGSFHASVGVGFCGPLNGWKSQFSEEKLGQLYENHGGYVSRVVRRTDELVREGWLLREDATAIKTDAAHSAVPSAAPVP